MRRHLVEIREFFMLVGRRVSAWLTGGVIAALLFVYEHARGNVPMSAVYLGLLVYIALASYLAWRSERRARAGVEEAFDPARQSAAQLQAAQQERRHLSVYWSFAAADHLRRANLEEVEHPFVLSTADASGERFAEVWTLIRYGIKGANVIGPPPNDLNAVKLPAPTKPGVIIYGRNGFADAIAAALSEVADVARSTEYVDELNAYYAKFGKTDVIGIAIGPGVPWKSTCLD
ncbi:hypothetical protein [Ralstonia solanacearum]|uniref:hypothetical protein n=1 Tax=Ralstonia solanacearum TaxID=305 RepID=UPI001E5AD707|nr:hypothetical protein [Ralstonia solanacearum]MDC6210101.1 hypothetical protein [Ralstonia solanacearum]MDD7802829.1 hypothetical protein [Ralstonia solanacearum]